MQSQNVIKKLIAIVTVDTVLDHSVIDIVLKCLYFTLQIAKDIACIIRRDAHDKSIFLKQISSNIYRNKETHQTIVNFKHIQNP